jgi:hypothetical protein
MAILSDPSGSTRTRSRARSACALQTALSKSDADHRAIYARPDSDQRRICARILKSYRAGFGGESPVDGAVAQRRTGAPPSLSRSKRYARVGLEYVELTAAQEDYRRIGSAGSGRQDRGAVCLTQCLDRESITSQTQSLIGLVADSNPMLFTNVDACCFSAQRLRFACSVGCLIRSSRRTFQSFAANPKQARSRFATGQCCGN